MRGDKNKSVIAVLFRLSPIFVLCALFLAVFPNTRTHTHADVITYSEVAEHPQAAAQSTATGKRLHDIAVFNGKVYAGYGDWSENTGPIAVNPLDLATDTFTGSEISTPTEAIAVWREIDDKLYAPFHDPEGSHDGGFAYGEPWAIKQTVEDAVHTFDITTLDGNDLWTVGSKTGVGAAVWHSEDGGDTWTVEQTEENDNLNGRYYWIVAFDGKIFVQASHIPGGSAVKSFDGDSWQTGTTDTIFTISGYQQPIVFDDKMISTVNGLSTFDGTTLSEVEEFEGVAKDFDIDGSYLYILRTDRTIARSSDLVSWQELGSGPLASNSIAVDNDIIYIGGSDSKVYRADRTVPDAPTLNITNPADGGTNSGTIALTADTGDSEEITKVDFYWGNTLITSDTSAPYTYNWDSTELLDGAYTIHAEMSDGFGNVISDSISITLDNYPDTDGDGVADSEENNAPNNGDGNKDGTKDRLQNTVASVRNPLNDKYLTLAGSGSCNQFQRVEMTSGTGLSLGGNQDLLAFASYELVCNEAGDSGTVKIYLNTSYDSNQLKLYKKVGLNTLPVTPYASMSSLARAGKKISVISLPLTDSGVLDDDGVADGVIIDPIAVSKGPLVGSLSDADSSSDTTSGLANTGINQITVSTLAALCTFASLGLFFYRARRLL